MTQIILNIPDNQLDHFIEVFTKMGLECFSQNDQIPNWQKAITLKRLKVLESESDQSLDFDEMINRLAQKHEL
jgi:hypothetical protein